MCSIILCRKLSVNFFQYEVRHILFFDWLHITYAEQNTSEEKLLEGCETSQTYS